MAKKSLGYVEMEWICPNCGTRNPGRQKTCGNCGYAQSEEIEFQQAAEEKIITDEKEIAQAKKGPDIHCFYCGARNVADAKTCSQCGGDLTQGAARKKGRVAGAHRSGWAKPIICDSCGAENPADADNCNNCGAALRRKTAPKPVSRPQSAKPRPRGFPKFLLPVLAVIVLAFLGCCAFFAFSTDDITARAESVNWTRSISIEELGPVEYEGWQDELPAEAVVGMCVSKEHHTQDSPAPDSQEVCGTPYTVDQGNGLAEVAQDCRYKVYEQWCEYTVKEWRSVDKVSANGSDYNPRWPTDFNLSGNQREGNRDETYKIIFNADGKRYDYVTGNFEKFQQVEIGSRWILKVNKLNIVNSIEPAE